MASRDVTIRGAGIFGLSAAWECLRLGAKVQVIDTVGIAAGASGGLVGALAPHAPEQWNPLKQFQLESLLLAEDWWREVQEAGGVDPLYKRSGRLQPLSDAAAVALAEERGRAAEGLWQGKATWRVIAAGPDPWQPASPSGFLIADDLTARIAPRAACAALAAALRAKGAEIVIGDAPEEGAVLHANGVAGLRDLSDLRGKLVGAGQKGQAALLAYDARDLPQIYAAGLHIVPHGDGTVAVGSTSESTWAQEGPDHQAEDLVARARAVLPQLREAEVLEYWAGFRPRAKTRGPIAGAHPERAGHYILNGGFKIGFGMAPKLAQGIAALILRGETRLPEAFAPARLWD